MFLSAHIAAGLVVGKLTGNYPLALVSATMWDIDHLVPYYRYGILRSPKMFWQAITRERDPYHGQRGLFHNLYSFTTISFLVWAVNPAILPTFAWGYFSHLALDALDRADFWPFWPMRRVNIRGPIPYFSVAEHILTGLLLLAFILS